MARRIITPRSKQVRIEGLADLQFRLNEIDVRLNSPEVKQINMRGAVILRDRARSNAPESTEAHKIGKATILPGTLKRAIYAAYGDEKKPDVLVGVSYRIAPHAHWVEYGTSVWSGHPYLRPAISQTRTAVVTTIADGYRALIAEYAR